MLNVVLLSGYTFGCHALRHLVGGKLDCFSCSSGAKTQLSLWSVVTKFNEHHMFWAWVSLFMVGFSAILPYLTLFITVDIGESQQIALGLAAGTLLVAFVVGSNNSVADPTNVTGHGLTYTKVTLPANAISTPPQKIEPATVAVPGQWPQSHTRALKSLIYFLSS